MLKELSEYFNGIKGPGRNEQYTNGNNKEQFTGNQQ